MGAAARPRARAYVACPVSPEEGLYTALKWCFQRGPAVRWETLGCLLPHPGYIIECPMLRRLRVRGVTMATACAATALKEFTGPLIVYCPDPRLLEIAEALEEPMGTVAVASSNAWMRPWVARHQPTHLDGQVL